MVEFPENRIIQISKTDLFKQFSIDEITSLLNNLHFIEKKYSAGEYIYLAESKVEYLLILVEGAVISEITSEIGKLLVIKDVKPPQIIIPAMLFSDVGNSINVKAVKDSVIIKIKKNEFERKLQTNIKLQKNFFKLLSNRFILILKKIYFLNFYSIRQKLVCYLLENMNEKDNISSQKMSITKLADFFGVERSSLSYELSKLEKEGHIEKLNIKDIKIFNPDEFKKMLN